MGLIRKFFAPRWRIIQRGNGVFYAQERCFGIFWFVWEDFGDNSVNMSVPLASIDKRKVEYETIDNYNTIKQVIKV